LYEYWSSHPSKTEAFYVARCQAQLYRGAQSFRVFDHNTLTELAVFPAGKSGMIVPMEIRPDPNGQRIYHTPPTVTPETDKPMKLKSVKPFIVWGPKGSTNPKARFGTEKAAQNAAEDMARKHPGQEFYVMKAVGVARQVGVEYLPVEPL
jgi:hypothetical protein